MTRFFAAALCLYALSCGGPSRPSAFERLGPCEPGEAPPGARCGDYEVFEDREAGAGRKIALRILLLPALANDPRPDPVFFLAGGPGQSATKLADGVEYLLEPVRRSRDVVLVDQRGTGQSGALECDLSEGMQELDFTSPLPPEKVQACLDSYDADPRLYTTPIAMDDLDEVRDWLGYDAINLYGGSYGTRAALVYLRRHEANVRSVVIDGVAPVEMTLPLHFAQDAQRALDTLIEDCEAAAPCHERFPELRRQTTDLFAELEQAPVRATFVHPRTGERIERTITREAVGMILTGMLYSPWLSSLGPLAIERAHAGDFQMLMPLAIANDEVGEQMSQGMFYSVMCSEDWPNISAEARREETRNTFLGEALFESRWKPCENWPRGAVPENYREPVRSDKPVLILSGELDPVTPPRWGELVQQSLPNARHVVAQGVAHGVSPYGCVPRLLQEFFDSADASTLDVSCVDSTRRPDFMLTPVATAPPEEDAQ
ncbi:MAG: alpha/beta hydrolase [Bryobacterales bacterium]